MHEPDEDERRLAAFVARLAALAPADWARLAAGGRPLAGPSAAARWRRLRAAGPLLRATAGEIGGVALEALPDLPALALDGLDALGDRLAGRRPAPPPPAGPSAEATADAIVARWGVHWEAFARALDGRPEGARWAAQLAAMAVANGGRLPAAGRARLYRWVEPVVPWAAL